MTVNLYRTNVGRYVNIKYGPAMQRFLETGHCMAGLLQKACFSEIKLAEYSQWTRGHLGRVSTCPLRVEKGYENRASGKWGKAVCIV